MLTLEKMKASGRELGSIGTFDPYLYHAEMPLSAVYYPLGFPLELTTNSEEVLEAADESWGLFRQQFDTPALRLRIGVLADGPAACPPAPVFRAQRGLFVGIADHANFCVNDVLDGFSFAWLNRAAASRRSYLRYHYLEAAALCHIANRYTAPIHAACVERNGHGVLLCGDSGAGKSTLCFGCARAGWTYITDDASFLLHEPEARRVMGNCHLMRLRPSACELFEEARGRPLTPRAEGKPSIELFTATVPGLRLASSSNVDYLVFLNRRDVSTQELTPFPKEYARKYIHQRLCEMDELRVVQLASVERLLEAEVLEIRYRDLDWAVDRLERLVRERS